MSRIKYYLSPRTWEDLLIIPENPHKVSGTRTTKVVKKPYGYIVHQYNNYITLYKHKVVLLESGFVKVFTTMDKNYQPIQKWITYYNSDGREIICFQDYDLEVTVFNKLVKGDTSGLELSERVY